MQQHTSSHDAAWAGPWTLDLDTHTRSRLNDSSPGPDIMDGGSVQAAVLREVRTKMSCRGGL